MKTLGPCLDLTFHHVCFYCCFQLYNIIDYYSATCSGIDSWMIWDHSIICVNGSGQGSIKENIEMLKNPIDLEMHLKALVKLVSNFFFLAKKIGGFSRMPLVNLDLWNKKIWQYLYLSPHQSVINYSSQTGSVYHSVLNWSETSGCGRQENLME